ncbi:copper amine oxidase N-terminal domain-containing protein [Ammonifex thiophilus]|uniref:copper amine oxidase N-terminal domain-containing protein n=1 Tax=Ammonifex thiophilus TaxID=444093 RepID=UPI0014030A47|nr:copper amine oxidase N-terminal domain-containing protein [Ammonifex thiophilus]
MKKPLLFALFSALVLTLSASALPALAGTVAEPVAKFVIDQRTYWVRGEPRQMDVAPFIENGRTYVPVRYLGYALGVPESGIGWDQAERKATLTKDGTTVELVVGQSSYRVNGQERGMDVAPLLKDGRVFLPARFVAEALGYKVTWEPYFRQVVVLTPGYEVSMDQARAGTLQPPPGAVAPTGFIDRYGYSWGFPYQAKRIDFRIGSRYATVTRPDGSTYQLDLGTECVVVTKPITDRSIIRKYPEVYPEGTYVVMPEDSEYTTAFYIPFIPVARAFGVPEQNIVWDGEHLAVFGYYGDVRNYCVMTPGSKEIVCLVVPSKADPNGKGPVVGTGHLYFPLSVKDGVPMLGVNSVNDFSALLFAPMGAPGLINATGGGSFDYETGTAFILVKGPARQ